MKFIEIKGIKKIGDRYRIYALFLCLVCLKEVIREKENGKRQKSCGCLKIKHGGKGTKLYMIWNSMKKRCLNLKSTNYKDYGGRGITICNDWLEFIPFRDWALNNGYKEGLQINRINNNGNYKPNNCNFVTSKENNRNRRGQKIKNKNMANKIREEYKINKYFLKDLAMKYNVSIATISMIINNKIWI